MRNNKGKDKEQGRKRRINHRQWDWRWRSKITEQNAESEHCVDITKPWQWERTKGDRKKRKKKKDKSEWMTGNVIGRTGAKAISEILKMNTTLKSLNLSCEKEEKRKRKITRNE